MNGIINKTANPKKFIGFKSVQSMLFESYGILIHFSSLTSRTILQYYASRNKNLVPC